MTERRRKSRKAQKEQKEQKGTERAEREIPQGLVEILRNLYISNIFAL